MPEKYDIWIDISNTPQVHLARAFVNEFRDLKIFVTGFRRGETEELMRLYGLNGHVFGSDNYNPALKPLKFALRSFSFLLRIPATENLLVFENAIPIPAAKMRGAKTILLLDNDLKFIGKRPTFQRLENKIKSHADYVIVPEAAKQAFETHFGDVYAYPGYKEHIYIADFIPDPKFVNEMPFEDYVVVRPESLTSLYVMSRKSIVPELCMRLVKENLNVVYLPRNAEEKALVKGLNVYIPGKALDGLNLAYCSKAVMTGSGTMAREAAVLGVPAASFFPGADLLAVDKDLISNGIMFHSRFPQEIVDYVLANCNRRKNTINFAKKVKDHVVKLLNNLINN